MWEVLCVHPFRQKAGREMSDFWIPQWKYQLVDWLARHFNTNASKFERIKKNRLYAMYIKIRRGYEELDGGNRRW